MRSRIDIGISAQSNRCAQVFRTCEAIDVIQLRFALDIEAVNTLLERVFDLLTRFAHSGERAARRIAPSCDHTIKLAAGNDVEARARIGEQVQDRAIRVRFDCVANQMIERRKRGIEPRVVI